jgi:hypothetical protein
MNENTVTVKDYIYCEDCDEFIDFWKYNHNLEDCGHEGCKWRYVTEEELKDCIQACKDWDCFKEEFLGPVLVITKDEDNIILRAS